MSYRVIYYIPPNLLQGAKKKSGKSMGWCLISERNQWKTNKIYIINNLSDSFKIRSTRNFTVTSVREKLLIIQAPSCWETRVYVYTVSYSVLAAGKTFKFINFQYLVPALFTRNLGLNEGLGLSRTHLYVTPLITDKIAERNLLNFMPALLFKIFQIFSRSFLSFFIQGLKIGFLVPDQQEWWRKSLGLIHGILWKFLHSVIVIIFLGWRLDIVIS